MRVFHPLKMTAAAALFTAFSATASAETIDFNINDLSPISLGPGGYITELVSNGVNIGAAYNWGVGTLWSWAGSTRDIDLPAGSPPPNYWEDTTILVDVDADTDAEWPYELTFVFSAYTNEIGTTYLDIGGFSQSINFDPEGGTVTLDPDGVASGSPYNIQIDLEQSWVDFGNGHISFAEYGPVEITTDWHTMRFVEIESGYFQSAHIVYLPVPEPETYAMLLAGLGIIGAVVRRRKMV
ncbi:MAG: PEP-CTERM sorting domain-containing protein [Azoarcus sp.]|nr:PEP-CTERM sorting domain-containing protein [Azoarcus sp.]